MGGAGGRHGVLAEGTLRIPIDFSTKRKRELLTEFVLKFRSFYPRSSPELSVTSNFVLQGEGAGGLPSYSLFYGGDYTQNLEDFLVGEIVTVNSLSDLNMVDLEDLSEREITKKIDANFEDSGVTVQAIVNHVFILRTYETDASNGGRRGRQVALF